MGLGLGPGFRLGLDIVRLRGGVSVSVSVRVGKREHLDQHPRNSH